MLSGVRIRATPKISVMSPFPPQNISDVPFSALEDLYFLIDQWIQNGGPSLN